jgi:signal transduction histidine kinase
LHPSYEHDGTLINVIGYGIDITERKQSEEALRALNDRMQLATQAAGFGVWDWDVVKNELVWDETLFKVFDVQEGEFSNNFEAWSSTLLPEDKEKAIKDVQMALEGEKDFVSEFRIVTKKKEVRYIAGRARVYRDHENRAYRMLGVNWDISESKFAEQKLKAYNEDLEKINKELDQFAYVVSHDLKAPLRAINNLSLWIEEDLEDKLEGDTKEQFSMLRGRVARMEGLINGILNYSRAGRLKTNPVPIDLNQFIPDLLSLLAPPEQFTIHIQENLPVLKTEKIALEQVFSNFISNAIKYNDNKNPSINIECKDAVKFWEFSVTDNGPGIEKEFHEKVFVIFQTLNARDKVESTGVGLAIVKKIVEEKGGKCWIESIPGEGASFKFTWPK